MRINKYIASCGISSRRKAEELIEKGYIKVNGQVPELSYKVQANDLVTFKGNPIKPDNNLIYIALNKPVGYVCTNHDKYADKTIFDLVDIDERIFSIGRLDKDSRGLIFLTNDGDLYNNLMHPKNIVYKKYRVQLDKKFNIEDKSILENGVDIGGYITTKSYVDIDKDGIYISISEGKNRQVRKMFQTLGYEVIDLKRVQIGEFSLGNLKEGEYKQLSKNEVDYLYSL